MRRIPRFAPPPLLSELLARRGRNDIVGVAMRWPSIALVCGLLGSCAPTPAVTVVHVKKKPVEAPEGDPVRLHRSEKAALAGVRSGAFIVRDASDWQKLWPGEPPPMPEGIDFASEMMFVVATEDAIVTRLHVSSAVETGSSITVSVKQTMLGDGCVHRGEERKSTDHAVAMRIDKPIRFVIEDESAPSCGDPPKAQIACRTAKSPSWGAKLAAKAGDVVECEQSSIVTGKYTLIDQGLSLVELPPGSNARLAFSKVPGRATLALDAFGVYAVRAEAIDEGGRRGQATAFIDVPPKKTRDVLLQLTWTSVTAGDYTLPPPRVVLRVTQEGPRGQRCSSEVPVPGLCDAKTRGSYTHMRIPASRRKLPLSLLYLEERAQDGPSPCVTIWFDGQKTSESCDQGHRHPEDRWELGTLDTATGTLAPPKPPAAKPAPTSG
jgi:hypothetical protein